MAVKVIYTNLHSYVQLNLLEKVSISEAWSIYMFGFNLGL